LKKNKNLYNICYVVGDVKKSSVFYKSWEYRKVSVCLDASKKIMTIKLAIKMRLKSRIEEKPD
jgi:hypothetical protein